MAYKGYFITGTDTHVGKTVVAAAFTHTLKACYWKPIQSGFPQDDDTATVHTLTGLSGQHSAEPIYRLKAPLSPHHAAALENITLNPALLTPPKTDLPLIVEGAGGVLVPITDDFLMVHLMQRLALPVVVVARTGLGTINHTLLTLETLRHYGLTIAGVVMNGEENTPNSQTIATLGKVPILAEVRPQQFLDIKEMCIPQLTAHNCGQKPR